MYANRLLTQLVFHHYAPQFYSSVARENLSTLSSYGVENAIRSYSTSQPKNDESLKNAKTKKKNSKPAKTKSMYPNLHGEVEVQLRGSGLSFKFYKKLKEQPIDTYTTSIMGKFLCHSSGCEADGWASKKIAVTIQLYQHNRYNAIVYHQRCKECNHLSRPKLDSSYAERVAYRLKKWNNIAQPKADYTYKESDPHLDEFCEACKVGVCPMSRSRMWI
ncbi:hypothetical protein CFIMG_003932RAa [Ceratocystis fimbriata CBS 114723]|uniref:3CxxC-type domain-containing protein n=1 Tax=Ceratocystis fimbriata CBS 114723 TaxID=1035309 RepID=A0A2C5WU89_9PEZI|nr:hypothetical protein CFIMG_003932RAa [Ceratocystis fimbriata CBS 114723]